MPSARTTRLNNCRLLVLTDIPIVPTIVRFRGKADMKIAMRNVSAFMGPKSNSISLYGNRSWIAAYGCPLSLLGHVQACAAMISSMEQIAHASAA
jgi:hypothetical protein